MKKNIEHIIRESLENHELAYNSGAWSALSAKLDSAGASSSDGGSSINDAIKSSLENYELPYAAAAWSALSARLDANPVTGVEQSVKTSLENYELPYAASAWTSLSAKLDAKSAPGSKTKWFIAASLLIAATTASFFIIDGSSEEKDTSKNSTELAHNKTNAVSPKTTNSSSTKDLVDTNRSNSYQSGSNAGEETPSNELSASNSSGSHPNNAPVVFNEPAYVAPKQTIDPTPKPMIIEEPQMAPFIMPALTTTCQGTSIKIANSNDYNMSIVYPTGATWTGKAKSQTNLNTSFAGTYIVGYMNDGQFIEEGSFEVNPAPKADFDFVDLGNIWKDGLPTTEVVATTTGIKYEWKYGKGSASGSEASPHFFTKGSHTIALTVTGSNGCKSSVTKTVEIEDNYNLGATNAFIPTSLDSKNNTFIPQLLKERDVKFKMIIVDFMDGHVMYETSDASQGWDGIDRTTGRLIEYHKSFVWKVTIENPQAGESPSYKGSGVAIPQ